MVQRGLLDLRLRQPGGVALNGDLPAPLVPVEVDLRAFDWFPFFHKRLRQSSFWKRASDLACRISVDFWAEAYEQVPAGSVPDDDHILSEWAGFGRRNVDAWLCVKDEVMSAWTRCSDGRWYHPTLCEVAGRAWAKQLVHQWERECDRIRKANGRRAKDGLEALPFPLKPSSADNPAEEIESGSGGHPPAVQGVPVENALRERGTRRKIEEDLSSSLRSEDRSPAEPPDRPEGPAAKRSRPPPKPRKHAYPADAFANWYARFPRKQARPAAEKAFRKIEAADDTPFADLLDGIDRFWRVQPDLAYWPHPATWLNNSRWLDQPASSNALPPTVGGEPRVSFSAGVAWPVSTVRRQVERWRADPSSWPEHALGPPPDAPGCKVPVELLKMAA